MRCLFFLLFLSTSAVHAQAPYALGARVGDTLDADERTYFGLFPRLPEATAYRFVAVGDSVVVEPVGALGPRLRLRRSAADSLARLTETFEDHPSVLDNPHWTASADFLTYIDARTPVPWPSVAHRVRVQAPEGVFSGYVLYTTDSLVVLAPTLAPRDATLPGAYALPRADLVRLDRAVSVRWARWGPLLGAAIGAGAGTAFRPVGGTALGALLGHAFAEIASTLGSGQADASSATDLDEAAYFNGTRPPELPPRSVAETLGARPRPRPAPVPRPARRHEWVSVGVQGVVGVQEPRLHRLDGLVLRDPPSRGMYLSEALGVDREPLRVPYRFDVAVRPIPWVRVGLYTGAFTQTDSLGTALGDERVVRTYGAVRPYAEAILPALRVGERRLELSVGGGRESYTLRSTQVAPVFVLVGSTRRFIVPVTAEVESEGTSWFGHVGVEVYTTRHTSLFVRQTWHAVPALLVPEFRNVDRQNSSLTLRLSTEHEVEGRFADVVIGSRVHF